MARRRGGVGGEVSPSDRSGAAAGGFGRVGGGAGGAPKRSFCIFGLVLLDKVTVVGTDRQRREIHDKAMQNERLNR